MKISAKFPGFCSCTTAVVIGAKIDFDPRGTAGRKVVGCEACAFTGETPARAPESGEEIFLAFALAKLAGLDGDRAAIRNGIGFSKYDTSDGHAYAREVLATGLKKGQWRHAKIMVVKYRKQVGEIPTGERAAFLQGCYALAQLENPTRIAALAQAITDFAAGVAEVAA